MRNRLSLSVVAGFLVSMVTFPSFSKPDVSEAIGISDVCIQLSGGNAPAQLREKTLEEIEDDIITAKRTGRTVKFSTFQGEVFEAVPDTELEIGFDPAKNREILIAFKMAGGRKLTPAEINRNTFARVGAGWLAAKPILPKTETSAPKEISTDDKAPPLSSSDYAKLKEEGAVIHLTTAAGVYEGVVVDSTIENDETTKIEILDYLSRKQVSIDLSDVTAAKRSTDGSPATFDYKNAKGTAQTVTLVTDDGIVEGRISSFDRDRNGDVVESINFEDFNNGTAPKIAVISIKWIKVTGASRY